MSEDAKKQLGRILLRQRAVTQPELDKALAEGSEGGLPLATRLTESGAISEIAALKALSEQSGVPGIDLNQVCVKLSDLSILPKEVAVRHKLLPVLVREDRIFVAMAAPTEKKVIDELEFVTGKHLYPYIALAGPLMRVIAAAYEARDRGEPFYVGPQCPPEILRRAGFNVPIEEPPPAVAVSPSRPATPPPPAPVRQRATPPPPPARQPTPPPAPFVAERAEVNGGPRQRYSPPPRKSDPDAGFRPSSRTPNTTASQPGQVVVDDAMDQIAGADELTDADFGLADRDLSVVAPLPAGPGGRHGGRPREGQRTILVVDDEADIRKLLRRVFEDRGYFVAEADRGLVALGLVKEHPPDCIVLDAMLPEVHGFDIAKRLKGTER